MSTQIVRKLNGRVVTEEEFRAASKPGRLKEMLEARVPPRANTDREFLAGHCNGNQFEGAEAQGDYLRSVAEAHGQDVTGKVYLSGLAQFPGDPEAWVGGKGDVEQVLDKRGWGATGMVNRPVTKEVEPTRIDVDPTLLQADVLDICDAVGAGPDVDKVDLAEQVYNKRTGLHKTQDFEPARDCPEFVAQEKAP